jgi:two-component system, NtrC family, response regulator AtoC
LAASSGSSVTAGNILWYLPHGEVRESSSLRGDARPGHPPNCCGGEDTRYIGKDLAMLYRVHCRKWGYVMEICSGFPGKPSILVVDDEPSILTYTKTLLGTKDYTVETALSGEEAIQKIQAQPPDLMLLDICMPTLDGLQTLQACKKLVPEQRVLMMSCDRNPSTQIAALRLGALDYITKPIYKVELEATVKRCLSTTPEGDVPILHLATGTEKEHIDDLENDLFFLAACPAMKQLRAQCSIIAEVDVPILLLGESGVGKEIFARLIHRLSRRAKKSFLKVNCAALPDDLLESELFGYEAGAFTGAVRGKPGKFEQANHGTILLDELGEMSTSLQAKLLHILQDGEFCRLGGRTNVTADVRVLAATNIDMQKAIAKKTFREDLYYRLNAFTIKIPPLRERREEIPFLLKHFMVRFSEKYAREPLTHSEALINACQKYHWPGNLRELGNFVKRYIVLRDENFVISELEQKSKALPRPKLASRPSRAIPNHAGSSLKSLVHSSTVRTELKALEEALQATHWNRKKAAARLGISYKALLNKLKRYQLAPPHSLKKVS